MKRLFMNFKTIYLLSSILFFGNIFSKSNSFSISMSSGISYISFNKLEGSYNNSSLDEIHYETKEKSNLSLSCTFRYYPFYKHNFCIGVDYTQINPLLKVKFDKSIQTYMEIPNIKYYLKAIPITFTYEYQLFNKAFSPFGGVGLSYIYTNIREEFLYTTRANTNYEYIDNIYSCNFTIGCKTIINKNWQIISQIIYRYSSALEFKEGYQINMSGFTFYIGILSNIHI